MITAPPCYSRLATASGWALALIYGGHAFLTTQLARTDRGLPLREELRGWHYLLGTLLFVTAVVRLWVWVRDPRPMPPPGLPATAFAWGRALALIALALLLTAPLLGLAYAWSDGLAVHLGGLTLPAAMGRDRAVWQASGYFHSGLGFMLILINLATLLSAAWFSMRHGHGLIRAFPPGHGAFALIGLSITVYSFATFRSPEPGPMAVAMFWGLVLAWALVARFVRRGRPAATDLPASPGGAGRLLVAAGVAVLLFLGGFGPWLMFRVTPIAGTPDVVADAGVDWHRTPAVATLEVRPPDAFEAAVEADTFKWCSFCHAMRPGSAQFKIGPNLHNIVGQRAGTVPGYGYSEAMRARREAGLIWTEQAIADYIADPQAFMPGTSMIISSGPIPDPRVQAAVVNILKRQTRPVDPPAP